MDTLMWEAKAAEGRGAALLRWVLDEGVRTINDPSLRTEVFVAGDRVVVIAVGEHPPRRLPDPPEELVDRAPHAWPFTRVNLAT
ncbi:hypothetical protein [Glycomyces harbinensis]|uniref:Uncharacterized protein n=1 Tax=Glycomyces harbinensis TaxID=58114 RepID=A0A1G6UZH0_9ACTN|nr:hypothetical protein [Glycomyces harbinensis]SDD46702.1 hypothetical protein SAMN05216270_104129 [Glycomyces harbinensis]